MKVVDLRSRMTRWALGRWRKADSRGRADSGFAAWYGGIVDRVLARRAARRPAAPAHGPLLVSVGNLALGGTGKTPVVGALARDLAERGLRGGILTRGFGSDLAGPLVVEAADARAGDEARWHAGCLGGAGWIVVQSRSRPRGLEFLVGQTSALDVVLLEDAHQTAGLPRHVDVVILDRWRVDTAVDGSQLAPGTGRVFPFGPWRESAGGAGRADILLVEEAPLPAQCSAAGQPVAGFRRRQVIRDPRTGESPGTATGAWAALAGIAHPEAFEEGVAEALGRRAVLAVRCTDHARYGTRELERVRREMTGTGAQTLVTTAKDWVKLSALWPPAAPILVAELEIDWSQQNALPDLIEERIEERKAGRP